MAGAIGGTIGGDLVGSLMGSGAGKAVSGALSGVLGKTIGGIAGSFLGPLGSMAGAWVAGKIAGLFKESQGHKDLMAGNTQIGDMKKSLSGQYGSEAGAQNASNIFGGDLTAAWSSQNLAGAERFKSLMGELAAKQSAFNSSLGGTLGKIKDLGGGIPEALRPYLTSLTDAKVLTQDNIDLITSMAGGGVVDFDKMKDAADRYGISVDAMGQPFKDNLMHKGWQQIVDDLDLLQRGGADMNAVLGSEGMQKHINELVQQSIKFGTTMTNKLADATADLSAFTPIVIVRLRNMTAIDASGLHALETLSDRLKKSGRTLILCGARHQPAQFLHQANSSTMWAPTTLCPTSRRRWRGRKRSIRASLWWARTPHVTSQRHRCSGVAAMLGGSTRTRQEPTSQPARRLRSLEAMRAMGAALKLRSAPIFVSARAAPTGNAAVAKKRETVNPVAAVVPITTKVAEMEGCRQTRAWQASRAREQQDADRLTKPEAGQHEVRAWPDLLERAGGIRQSKEEQHELDGLRPPVLELIERVDEKVFSRIEQSQITRLAVLKARDVAVRL